MEDEASDEEIYDRRSSKIIKLSRKYMRVVRERVVIIVSFRVNLLPSLLLEK